MIHLLAADTSTDSYRAGEVVGYGLGLLLAVVLLVKGLQGLRARPAPRASADPWAHDAVLPAGSAVKRPSQVRSTIYVIIGGLLLLGAAASGVTHLNGSSDSTAVLRTITVPQTVLGLPLDAALTKTASAQAGGQGGTFEVYRQGTTTLVVQVGTQHSSSPKLEVASIRQGAIGSGLSLSNETDVDPGPLGGSAECWTTTINARAATFCALVDKGSFLTTVDTGATTTAAAADRARTVRAALLH